MSSPAPLPEEINRSAHRGELQKVVKWLRKGGAVDALFPSAPTLFGDGVPEVTSEMNDSPFCYRTIYYPRPQLSPQTIIWKREKLG